jgi:signal transduction histidine kinase
MTEPALQPATEIDSERVNVLLVDDQPGKLLVYETILSDLNINLIKAHSASEALNHLLRMEIPVVLMDVSMPEIDGFELADVIRQHPRYQKTAIIFVSAVHLSDVDRIRGYRSGAVDYVSVPIIPELLRAKVSVFTQLYRKTRESERLTRELEHRVAERTAELEASITRQIELARQLRQADRRKDEFLALLAHELRNPLAPVRNAINVMRVKDTSDAELIWCRDVIDRQTSQLTRLVDDLLDISRITQGKVKLRREIVNLADVVDDAIESCRPLIDSHHHKLTVALPKQPVMVNGDPARLIQVVSNLLNNAAKYQHDGGMIDVTVTSADGVGSISVRDRGIGIEPELMTHVFDLFWQAERTPDREQGGLGIGLSLVRNLVEIHGGTVRGTSDTHGGGTEFEIRLPVLADAVGDDAPREARVTPDDAATLRRILIVDDKQDAADSMAMLLRLYGHQVLVAHGALQALEIAAAASPSVVLLDIGLPEMDGYEVCRRLRQQGMTDTQIIAMTGYGQDRDRQLSQEAGFDAHTVKPVDLDEVLRLLASHPRSRAAAH